MAPRAVYGDYVPSMWELRTVDRATVALINSPTSADLKLNTAEVMAALNWRFGWSGPVMTRY